MKFIPNKNQPLNIRIESDIQGSVYVVYVERILKIMGWIENCINKERARILLDAMLVLEKQNNLFILYDFEILWQLLYRSRRDN